MNERKLSQKYIGKGEKNETSLSSLKMLIAKQAEILSKLRDWFQETGNLRELIDEYLNLEVQLMDHGVVYDLNRLKWVKAEGPSGAYEYADKKDNMDPSAYEDFNMLLEDLREHGGSVTRQGYFIWLFDKLGDRVGRKPANQVRRKKEGAHK